MIVRSNLSDERVPVLDTDVSFHRVMELISGADQLPGYVINMAYFPSTPPNLTIKETESTEWDEMSLDTEARQRLEEFAKAGGRR
jgi:hypothetical protein